jgi:hypothetical protein
MEMALGFCLYLACAEAADATLHYRQFPPYEICVAGNAAASDEHDELSAAVMWADWYSTRYSMPIREARDTAWRNWGAWCLVKSMKTWPPLSPDALEDFEDRLIVLIGEENFRLGLLPWPNSWR